MISTKLVGDASLLDCWFWLLCVAELLFVAIRDTMDVGDVVSEELEEFEADDLPPLRPLLPPALLLLLLELELELVEFRMVDEVTEIGGVPADSKETGGEPDPPKCAPN